MGCGGAPAARGVDAKVHLGGGAADAGGPPQAHGRGQGRERGGDSWQALW